MSFLSPHPTSLIQARTQHDQFPNSILQGMLSPNGATSQAVNEMNTFIRQFFILDLPDNFYYQIAIIGGFICFLYIVGTTCVLRRMQKKTFWLFKFQRRSEGIYIVPNALNLFLIFVGFYGLALIAFLVVYYQAYKLEDYQMQYHISALNLVIWWPVYIGGFMAGWGSFYTAPGALEKGRFTSSKLGRFTSRPLMINIFCLGTPIILIASLLTPIILFQKKYSLAFNAYQSLNVDLIKAIASSPNQTLSISMSQGFLNQASQVWQMQSDSIWYCALGYSIWSVWAGILLLFYIPAGGYLSYLLWNQFQRQSKLVKEIETQKMELDREKQQEDGRIPSVLLFQPLAISPSSPYQNESQIDNVKIDTQSVRYCFNATPDYNATSPVTNNASPLSMTSNLEANKSGQEMLEEADAESSGDTGNTGDTDDSGGPAFFFPSLSPETVKRTNKRNGTKKGSPKSRCKYLRRCFINMSVLYVAIVLAASLYLGTAASLARLCYQAYLHNPAEAMNLVMKAVLVTGWGSVLFGSLSIFAILARFADPVNYQEDDKLKKKKIKQIAILPRFFNRNMQRSTSDKTLINSIVQQDQNKASSFHNNNNAGDGITESVDNGVMDDVRSDMSKRVAIPNFIPHDSSQGTIYLQESQIISRHRAGSLIQSTRHGDMLLPDPEHKPLVPERPPILEALIWDSYRIAPLPPSILSNRPRRRTSDWELNRDQSSKTNRRNSDAATMFKQDFFYNTTRPLDRTSLPPPARPRNRNSFRFDSSPAVSSPPTGPLPPTPESTVDVLPPDDAQTQNRQSSHQPFAENYQMVTMNDDQTLQNQSLSDTRRMSFF